MTLIKQESHILTCDSCGHEMQIDGIYIKPKGWRMVFSNNYAMKYDKHYCPDCHIIDEDGEVIIRKKEDKCE